MSTACSPGLDDFEVIWPAVDAVQGWLPRDQAQIMYALAGAYPAPTIVEIGTFLGRSAVLFGQVVRQRGGHVWCVDPFDYGTLEMYQQQAAILPDGLLGTWTENIARARLTAIVTPVIGVSADVHAMWGRPIDVLYIDGDHAYETVSQDVALWSPWVRPGGLLMMDDVCEPGPGRAMRDLFGNRAWEPHPASTVRLFAATRA